MREKRRRQAGFSLMEVTIVLGVASIVLIVAYQILEDSYRTALSLEARNDLLMMAQRPTNSIQSAIYQADTIFDNDASGIGTGYYNRLVTELPALFTPAPGTLLPIATSSASFGEDVSGDRHVGNCLLIARQLPPISVDYAPDPSAPSDLVPFPIDRYRFELFYLRRCDRSNANRACAGTHGFGNTSYIYDLVRARTIDFADYFQLNPLINPDVNPPTGPTFTATQRSQIAAGLAANGLTRAWDPSPGNTVSTAFYTITTTGTYKGRMTANSTQALTLYGTPDSVDPEILRGAAISGRIQYSIAFRNPAESENLGIPAELRPQDADGQFNFRSRMSFTGASGTAVNTVLRIPRFAADDVVTATFPSGFEVKVGGVGAGQRVMVRVMTMAQFMAGTYDAQESVVIGARGMSL
jgi:prepilin-type N-terminal cleavage/methylation domain-containing protein